MMVDDADDMESISDDARFGEVLANQSAIYASQIHADYAHPFFARQALQVALQGSLTASQHDIKDFVALEVTEGGGITVAPGEKMLIDAEYPWAGRTTALGRFALEKVMEPAFHGGAADSLSLPQTAATDAVPVAHEHAPAERLSSSFPRQNAGKTLPETAAAFLTSPFARFQL